MREKFNLSVRHNEFVFLYRIQWKLNMKSLGRIKLYILLRFRVIGKQIKTVDTITFWYSSRSVTCQVHEPYKYITSPDKIIYVFISNQCLQGLCSLTEVTHDCRHKNKKTTVNPHLSRTQLTLYNYPVLLSQYVNVKMNEVTSSIWYNLPVGHLTLQAIRNNLKMA